MKIAIEDVTVEQIQVWLKVARPDTDCSWCGVEMEEEGQRFCSEECWLSWGGMI